MNVHFYGFPFPSGMAMTNRLKLYCKALQESNADIVMTIYSEADDKTEGSHDGIKYIQFKKKKLIQTHIDSYYLMPLLTIGNFIKASKSADVVFINRFGWYTTFLMYIISRIRGFKLVQELNENPYSPNSSRLQPVWLRKINRFIALNTVYRMLDGYICISKPLFDLANKYKKRNAITIQIPILCDCFAVEEYEPILKDPYIFNAGFSDPDKDGYYAVLEGFGKACQRTEKNLNFIQTVKSAPTPVLNRINKIIREYNIEDRVHWLGFIPKQEVDNYRKGTLLGILNKPSNWQNDYNFPTKLGEYLAAGVPVIASRTGELGRYLEDDRTAYLIDANDSEQIASNILRILENQQMAKEIGLNGKKMAMEHFYYKNYIKAISNFFFHFSKV